MFTEPPGEHSERNDIRMDGNQLKLSDENKHPQAGKRHCGPDEYGAAILL